LMFLFFKGGEHGHVLPRPPSIGVGADLDAVTFILGSKRDLWQRGLVLIPAYLQGLMPR
jgi:hypothetical protein